MTSKHRNPASVSLGIIALITFLASSVFGAMDGQPITHSFLATGGETFIADGEGKIIWQYPLSTRDGWVLDKGNILLAVTM